LEATTKEKELQERLRREVLETHEASGRKRPPPALENLD